MPIYKINYNKCKKPYVLDSKVCNIPKYNCLDKNMLIDIGASKDNKYLYCYNSKGHKLKK